MRLCGAPHNGKNWLTIGRQAAADGGVDVQLHVHLPAPRRRAVGIPPRCAGVHAKESDWATLWSVTGPLARNSPRRTAGPTLATLIPARFLTSASGCPSPARLPSAVPFGGPIGRAHYFLPSDRPTFLMLAGSADTESWPLPRYSFPKFALPIEGCRCPLLNRFRV